MKRKNAYFWGITGHVLVRPAPASIFHLVFWLWSYILGYFIQGKLLDLSVIIITTTTESKIFLILLWLQAEESWLVSMVAIMAAMGTGELNAEEHLTPDKEDGDTSTTTFKECVRVFAMLFFVILIVTLYFNLLIGYAVSDIQVRIMTDRKILLRSILIDYILLARLIHLQQNNIKFQQILKDKAKTLQLSNKLSTIYTIESFLTTGLGEAIVRFKCKFDHILCRSSQRKINKNALDSIFVMPPSDYVQ